MYARNAATTVAVTLVPSDSARFMAARHTFSGIRMARNGVGMSVFVSSGAVTGAGGEAKASAANDRVNLVGVLTLRCMDGIPSEFGSDATDGGVGDIPGCVPLALHVGRREERDLAGNGPGVSCFSHTSILNAVYTGVKCFDQETFGGVA